MSFEANLPKHLVDLKEKRSTLRRDRSRLIHDCNCDFCEHAGAVMEENQEAYDKLTAEIASVDREIERLKAHAKLHNIKLNE